jgi:hypothetical protein
VDTELSKKEFPDDPKDREAMAERLSDEVRALRLQLDEVAAGPARKTQRRRILLMIDVKRWKMGLLNPKKYGKKSKPTSFF